MSVFPVLENFVASRLSELLDHMSKGAAAFNDLPKSLQRAGAAGVIGALAPAIRRLATDDGIRRRNSGPGRPCEHKNGEPASLVIRAPLDGQQRQHGGHQADHEHPRRWWRPLVSRNGSGQACGVQRHGASTGLVELLRRSETLQLPTLICATVIAIRSMPTSLLRIGLGFDPLATKNCSSLPRGGSRPPRREDQASGVPHQNAVRAPGRQRVEGVSVRTAESGASPLRHTSGGDSGATVAPPRSAASSCAVRVRALLLGGQPTKRLDRPVAHPLQRLRPICGTRMTTAVVSEEVGLKRDQPSAD